MLKIKEYVRAQSLEQAYELNQKRTSCVLGGMLWLKMQDRNVQTAIDLSDLGLDQIEEREDCFRIGCMVTLRQLEQHEGLNRYTGGAVRESVRSIVGVQFRNLATVGGSVFGRFGFSDVLTCLMALDTEVELYHRGRVPLETFAGEKQDRDILVRLIIRKTPMKCVYLSQRNTKTDFPVLTCAVSVRETVETISEETADVLLGKAVIGARPGRAICLPVCGQLQCDGETQAAHIEKLASELASRVPTGSNMRAGAAYRSVLARVLLVRGLTALMAERSEADED